METKKKMETEQPMPPKQAPQAKPEAGSLRKKKLTPLQQLIAEKIELRRRCRTEQQTILDNWAYLKENSGKMIFSGITDLLFPQRKIKPNKKKEKKSGFWEKITNNLPYYLAVAREGLSVAWYLTRPIYLKWLMSRRK